MKRTSWIAAVGAALLIAGYFGFPPVFRYIDAAKGSQREIRALKLRDVGHLPASNSLPQLAFLRDLDEIRFLYLRSFDPQIEITVIHRPVTKSGKPILRVSIMKPWAKQGEPVERSQKEISEETFQELSGYVLRQDITERSLAEREGGADGSTWVLEGRKGQFTVRHIRWCPPSFQDKTFVAVGKRLFELADIRIPDDRFY